VAKKWRVKLRWENWDEKHYFGTVFALAKASHKIKRFRENYK
jgi:hypothetical protein